jgi:acetyl-CoA C-acetyltransferase
VQGFAALASAPVTIDPRTPVLVGSGQTLHRAEGLDDAIDASQLMADAVRLALADAGLASLEAVASVRVVGLLSWKYGNPGWVVADHLGLACDDFAVTPMGGNGPQSLVNATALEIQRGDIDVAILTGGEAWRTRMRARKLGVEMHWPTAPDDSVPRVMGDDLEMNHPDEIARHIVMPVQVYPMFETAIRAAAGRTPEDHEILISELWARFSEVAADNPNAWIREAKTAEEIRTVSAQNRMVGLPYPKYMNSNNDVDMGAALIMCSAAKAEELGVPRDRWVFIHAGTDCHEHPFISNRWSFHETPAIELGGRLALELAGITIDDIDLVDLYSCFPAAVQLGAQSLGLSLDRQLTRTGGLPFAGGPWNNYVMHSIATMMDDLREQPGARGLVWGNGGYTTKHAFGIYSTEPPAVPFRHAYPQDQIDAMPRRELALPADAAGPATIEAYTVMFSRDGEPEQAIAACLLADGRRAWGTSTDTDLVRAMCVGEWVGRVVELDVDGGLGL